MPSYESYVPQTIGELDDFLGFMILYAPTFKDPTGFDAERDIDTVFTSLTRSLEKLKGKLGEPRYLQLVDMAARMREHFDADAEDANGRTDQGRNILFEMEEVLKRRTPKIGPSDS